MFVRKFIPSSFAFWILALERKHMILEFGRDALISKLVELRHGAWILFSMPTLSQCSFSS
ncbi:hypothetical protein ERO13_A10G232150v2 [Gossypium hirsutum]|nr:hypothetical protein ERO13_A10G232150v2 [Gossypium hirsutum]